MGILGTIIINGIYTLVAGLVYITIMQADLYNSLQLKWISESVFNGVILFIFILTIIISWIGKETTEDLINKYIHRIFKK